jgi:putative spermidine/putrescine transport system substrate-binding protein
MEKDGTVDKDILADQPQLEGDTISYTNDDSTRITAWLQSNWDKTIGN